MERVAALVIAGRKGRYGSALSFLTECGGRSLLGRTLADVSTWPVELVVVVLGADAEELVDVVDFDEATVVLDPDWTEGIASMTRAGIDVLSREGDFAAVIITYGDLPGITAADVTPLFDAFRKTRARTVVPRYRYQTGPPIVVSAELWDRLLGLEGDSDVEQLIQVHPEWVEEVRLDRVPPRRILSEDDLARFRSPS